MSIPTYPLFLEANPNDMFKGQGLRHNSTFANYRFSQQPDWYFEYESDLHVINFDNTTGLPQTMSITLPYLQNLQYASRVWFVYYKAMNAGDTLEIYTLAGSGNTINDAVSPFIFGPFVYDINPGVAVCVAHDNNYTFRFQSAPSHVGAPMVRFVSSSTYAAPDPNQYALISETDWQTTGAAAYMSSRVDITVPITGATAEVIHPGMEGYIVKTSYTDSDANVVDAYECTQSGYYKISPNFQTRYQYAQTSAVLDETVTTTECWFKVGDVDNNVGSIPPLHKMNVATQPLRQLGSATVDAAEIQGNLSTTFVAHLDAGSEYYFSFVNLMDSTVVPNYANYDIFGDVFFELVKVDPAPTLFSAMMVEKAPTLFAKASAKTVPNLKTKFKGAPPTNTPKHVFEKSTSSSGFTAPDALKLSDLERVVELMLEKNEEKRRKQIFDEKQKQMRVMNDPKNFANFASTVSKGPTAQQTRTKQHQTYIDEQLRKSSKGKEEMG